MKKIFVVGISMIMIVSMTVVFGLGMTSTAAENAMEEIFHESGTVYNNREMVHAALGTYLNVVSTTYGYFELYYSGDSYPPSQLKGTTNYRTYYEVVGADDIIEVELTNETAEGGNGTRALLSAIDNNSAYRTLSGGNSGIVYHFRFTNTIQSVNGNMYYGSRSNGGTFRFNRSGSYTE